MADINTYNSNRNADNAKKLEDINATLRNLLEQVSSLTADIESCNGAIIDMAQDLYAEEG